MALIAHWPLNGDILDYSGNGFHLTNNGATINNEGKIGKCYEFNGTNNYLNLNKFPLYQEEKITFSFWCYLKSNGAQNFLCSREAVGNGFCIFYISNGIRFDFGSQWQIPNSNLELNKWHHCIFIRNKNKRKFYLNGQFIAETNDFGDFNTQVLNRFSIGASYPASYANFLNGKLNDIKLFNHELSKKEIKELYQTKILDWKFNECEEPTINLLEINKQTKFNNFTSYENIDSFYKVECVQETNSFYNKVMKLTVTKDKENDGKWNLGEPNGVLGYSTSKKIDLIPGKKYTLTYRYKTKNYQKGSIAIWSHSRRLDGTTYSSDISGLPDTKGEWKIFKYNFTCPNDVNGRHFNQCSIRHNNQGFEYYVDWMQLEEKEYDTEYTVKERKGKIIDSSGYKNHGLIELNSSPKWNEDEYVFNGINSVIKTNKIILKKESSTFNFWIKMKEDRSFSICGLTNSTNTISLIDYINNPTTGKYFSAETKNNCNSFNSPILNNFNPLIYNMITIKFDNLKSYWYINGKFIGETTDYGIYDCNNSANPNGPQNLTSLVDNCEINYFGYGAYQPRFNGSIKEIKHFATALSEQDIKELYENSMTIDKNNNIICNEIDEFSNKNIFNFKNLINSSNSRNEIIKINENNSFKTISKIDDGYTNHFSLIESVPRNKTIIFEFFITKIKNKLTSSNNNETEIQFFLFDKISHTVNKNVGINITELNKKKFCSLEIVNNFCDFATAIRLDNNHVGAEYIIEDLNIYIKEEKNNSFIEKNGILNKNINENIIFKNTNLLDYTLWKDGQINSIGNFNKNGNTNDDCKRIIKTNPLNQKDIIWACESNDVGNTDSDGTGPDGGWNTNFINIDNTKTYRMSVWIKRENMGSGSGSIYFGPTNSNVDNERIYNFNNTANTNPYFYSSNTNSFNNEWILYISYVFPNSSTQIPINDAGGYNIFGNKVIIFDSSRFFKFGPNTTKLKHRTYLYYSSKTDERVYWYRPRIDLVNGEEPSINELIRCGEHPPLLNFDYNIFNNNVLTKINKNNELICNTISEV